MQNLTSEKRSGYIEGLSKAFDILQAIFNEHIGRGDDSDVAIRSEVINAQKKIIALMRNESEEDK